MYYKGSDSWCKWAEDTCEGASCNYAQCAMGRILANGVCGMTVKRRTVDDLEIENTPSPVQVRGSILKRFRDKDLY